MHSIALQYELEKKIRTEADISRLGWHDAKVYAMAERQKEKFV